MEKSKKKILLECIRCGHVQAVKTDDVWSCGRCKKLQAVDAKYARSVTESGKALNTCQYCGHV